MQRRLRYAAEPLADARVAADFVPRPGELLPIDGLPLRRREQLRTPAAPARPVRSVAGRRS